MADKERLEAFLSAYILGGQTVVTGKKKISPKCWFSLHNWFIILTDKSTQKARKLFLDSANIFLLLFLFFFFLTAHTIIVVKAGWKQTKPIVYFCFIWQSQNNCCYVAAYSPSLFHYRISHNMQKAFTWIIILQLNQILTFSTNTEFK